MTSSESATSDFSVRSLVSRSMLTWIAARPASVSMMPWIGSSISSA